MDFVSRASRFCEQVNQTGIAQVSNSWSCIAFLLIGVLIITHAKRTKQFINNRPIYSYLFGLLVATVGFTSFWNHAALNFWGGFTDVWSMYLLASFAILLSLESPTTGSIAKTLSLWAAVNIPLAAVAASRGVITDYVFAFLIFLLIAVELLAQQKNKFVEKKYFWLSLGTLLVAFGIWQLDIRGIWCNPESLIQGHAVWHLLCAIASYFLYLYLLSRVEFSPKIAAN